MNSSWKYGFIVVAALLQTACPTMQIEQDSRIKEIDVEPVVQGEEPVVNVSILLPPLGNKRVQNVTAEFRSTLESNRPWVVADGDFSGAGSGNNLTGTLPALNYGPYEVRLNILLRSSPSDPLVVEPAINELIVSNPVPFNVGVDTQECFKFNVGGSDTQNWSHTGYRLISNDEATDSCPSSLIIGQSGLSALVSSLCLPNEQVRFDMLSPDVMNRPGWENSRSVVLFAGTNVANWLMQPIIGRDNNLPSLAPVNSAGEPIFYSLSLAGGTMPIRVPLYIEEGLVNQLRVRFFSAEDNVNAGQEGFVFVRAACPLPDRPG